MFLSFDAAHELADAAKYVAYYAFLTSIVFTIKALGVEWIRAHAQDIKEHARVSGSQERRR